MVQIYALSFWFILAFLVPLWLSAMSRKEYGDRPFWLLVSLVIFMISGILVGLSYFNLLNAYLSWSLLLAFIPQVLYPILFTVTEYSVHNQRIKKNLLQKEFNSRLKIIWALLAGMIIVLLIIIVKPNQDLTIPKIFLAALIIVFYAYNISLFSFEEGIIRFNRMPFVLGIVCSFLGILFNGTTVSPLGSLFLLILNITYAIKVFHEYFWYRMEHFNQVHIQHEKREQSRTRLINEILAASQTEEQIIIKNVLEQYLSQFQNALTNPNVKIKSMMLFTRKGDKLQVESDNHIIGYCTPLINIETLKRMNQEAAHTLIKEHKFSILPASETNNVPPSFPEDIIQKMITNHDITLLDNPPTHLAAIFKLIIFSPIFNQNELLGMLVLFKESSNYLFPKERSILNSLNDELSIALTLQNAKRIQEDKNRLSKEMDVARTIQESVLPRTITIEGYDIASYMKTASEVGGDVYDFIGLNNKNYLAIGDVAGHGLPAGLMALIFMSALQGSIKTMEELGLDLPVSKIYDIINKVLVKINRDRIGSDKFMTGNILEERNGNFTYAGSHLIGLVYRADKQEVEEISGMIDRAAFLGLSEYADASQSLGTCTLNRGDILLLYTDGLIEARNKHNELYGLENVKKVMKANAHTSAEDLRKELMNQVSQFAENGDLRKYQGNFADDISMIILKRV
ncbi:PP2C family protein-serine/threonine phosphatase [Gracilinema caldarium]|uniref:PP2C family protein-serine/threonine phosphatase n=1 Tax=Gracilinema caldarium TaxID=215591 RepID=UPI0026F25EF4|nr:SpoIIE family protein phosphatase [Gracilinema caldarium]